MGNDFIQETYDLESQAQIDDYYSAWAASYDAEVARQGYRTPERCAQALAIFTPADQPVLDIGCGTGLSGAALRRAGFSDVSGTDVNPKMLAVAQQRDVYESTWQTDPSAPFPFTVGTYAAITAVGVIGIGAAPPALLTGALHALDPGGHLAFSYNDAALDQPEYATALTTAIASGLAIEVFSERGPHFAELDSYSTVFVLRRSATSG